MDTTLLLHELKKRWGYDGFRGVQQDIIESILSGRDTLGLMPTGGGKSLTFQLPSLLMEGTCLVVTPLIALMKDQVDHLRQRGIRAAALYSGQSRREQDLVTGNAQLDAYRLLYVSPERLQTPAFRQKLRHIKLSFICVDEAHCISQWGYDFRPSYLEIGQLRKELPGVPVLALTATATPRVVDDIQQQLHFGQKNVFSMSFERKNLSYVVRHTGDKPGELLHILQNVAGAAIVYTRNREGTKDMAAWLAEQGVSATFYHAGLDHATRNMRQQEWQQGRTRVMVATNAFGMGIDKADVRVVVHIDMPNSIEAYFQEAGRAGRDGQPAYCVLLHNERDEQTLLQSIDNMFPPKEYIRQVYDHLACFFQLGIGLGQGHSFLFDEARFCRYFHHFPLRLEPALHLLARAGYIDYDESGEAYARLRFNVERDRLYMLQRQEPREERVIEAMLRLYSGLFVDYERIELTRIAERCAMTPPEVYATLRALTQQGVVSFIPERRLPHIRYTQRRERSEHLYIGRDVYDDRRSDYEERVRQMLRYVNTPNVCRSRLLLDYFGERHTTDCGCCDVCRSRRRQPQADIKTVRQAVTDAANKADAGTPSPEALRNLPYPTQLIQQAVKELAEEEVLNMSQLFKTN
ncbi:MAG: RecQ family ATP-dependent DNA helicase [Prevotella sp.]|nr:RecQ family ATP-dependent DNA helicase [Prevotella sp.]